MSFLIYLRSIYIGEVALILEYKMNHSSLLTSYLTSVHFCTSLLPVRTVNALPVNPIVSRKMALPVYTGVHKYGRPLGQKSRVPLQSPSDATLQEWSGLAKL